MNKSKSLAYQFRFLADVPVLSSIIKPLWIKYRNQRDSYKSRHTKKLALQMHKQSTGMLKTVTSGIIKTIEGNMEPEEKKWVNKLESQRKKLSTVDTEISVTDYGAGSSNLNLSEEQMYQGRKVSTTIKDVCKHASQPYFWSLFIFNLIRELKPSIYLELGTALGISASYAGAGLKLNNIGRVVTMEGSEALASCAATNFRELGLDNIEIIVGRFQDTLASVLSQNKYIDFAFIDGHHDEAATVSYFKQIMPNLSDQAVIIFDDITWSVPMKRAWNTIAGNNKVNVSIDLSSKGLCIIDNNIKDKQSYNLPIYF
jgi:hypothetical protein